MGVESFLEIMGDQTIGLKSLFFLVLGGVLIYVQYFKKEGHSKQRATVLVPERKIKKRFLEIEDRIDAIETRVRKVESECGIHSPPRFGSNDTNDDDDQL